MKFKIGYPRFYDESPDTLKKFIDFPVDMNNFYANIEKSTRLQVQLR